MRALVTPILGLALSIGVAIALLFFDDLPDGFEVVAFAFGSLVAITVTSAEQRIVQRFHRLIDHKEIFSGITEVSFRADPDLTQALKQMISRFTEELDDIKASRIRVDESAFFQGALERVRSAKKSIKAIHVVPGETSAVAWKAEPRLTNYYLANLEAAKRGVDVERIFVVPKIILADPHRGGRLHPVFTEMRDQELDGLTIYVVSTASIEASEISSYKEFLICDNQPDIYMNYPRILGEDVALPMRSKNSEDLSYYRKLFEDLKESGMIFSKYIKTNKIDLS